ncbi:MAG TPA: amicyanin [Devosia sp.]
MHRTLSAISLLAVLLGAVLPAGAGAAEYVVVIEKMKFGPLPDTPRVGDTIVWQNNDIFRHTATATDKSFDIDLPPKSKASMTLSTAGNIAFLCRFHPGMKGVLEVAP